MVGPRRIAHVHDRVGSRNPDQFGTKPERTAAANGLDRRSAVGEPGGQRPQCQANDPLVEIEVARRSDVALRRLRPDQRKLCLAHGGRYRCIAGIVAIDADTQVHLERRRIATESDGHAEDRIGRKRFQRFEHEGTCAVGPSHDARVGASGQPPVDPGRARTTCWSIAPNRLAPSRPNISIRTRSPKRRNGVVDLPLAICSRARVSARHDEPLERS